MGAFALPSRWVRLKENKTNEQKKKHICDIFCFHEDVPYLLCRMGHTSCWCTMVWEWMRICTETPLRYVRNSVRYSRNMAISFYLFLEDNCRPFQCRGSTSALTHWANLSSIEPAQFLCPKRPHITSLHFSCPQSFPASLSAEIWNHFTSDFSLWKQGSFLNHLKDFTEPVSSRSEIWVLLFQKRGRCMTGTKSAAILCPPATLSFAWAL